MIASTKTCEKPERWGEKKTRRTLYPDTLLGRGLHPPTLANQTTHDSKKQEKKEELQ
jgi:hypothetical protein